MKLFITGTDTDVGKTYVTIKLIEQYKSLGYKVLGIKPVSAGGDDASLIHQAASYPEIDLKIVNPFNLKQPIAPHIAAKLENIKINKLNIINKVNFCFTGVKADVFIIEGAGGWLLPLNKNETMADVVAALDLEVVMVVGIKLGCLNHAMLTLDGIKAKGCKIRGWVANIIDPHQLYIDENINFLKNKLDVPLLEIINYRKLK